MKSHVKFSYRIPEAPKPKFQNEVTLINCNTNKITKFPAGTEYKMVLVKKQGFVCSAYEISDGEYVRHYFEFTHF